MGDGAMVKEDSSVRGRGASSRRFSVLSLVFLAACAKLVGISDTEVTRDSGEGGSATGGAGGTSGTGGAIGTGGGGNVGTGGTTGTGGAMGTGGAVGTGGRGGSGGATMDASATGGSAGRDATAEQGGSAGQGTGGQLADGSPGDVRNETVVAISDATVDQVVVDGGCITNAQCPANRHACESGQCVLRGPSMVQVGLFWIDSTEVTVGQYRQFLTAKGNDTSGQPSACGWNTSYYDFTIPFFPDNFPIGSIDWCDARAFCDWAGKRLCGHIGGGPIATTDFFTPTVSQWYLACGGPQGSPHPTGTGTCNNSSDQIAAAGTTTCEGFYPGIFDLEGNMAEWIDSCSPDGDSGTGSNDTCHLAGGSYIDTGFNDFCDEGPVAYPRNCTAAPFGFRCCSD